MKSLFITAEEACLAVGIDFDGIYPAPGKNHRLDITGDPRGKGDANIYTFPDGSGGCVTNFKTRSQGIWRDAHIPTDQITMNSKVCVPEHDPKLKKLWEKAQPVKSHPYCERKCIKPTKRIRQVSCEEIQVIFRWAPWDLTEPLLCIPLVIGKHMVSMQFIDANGNKRFIKGHKTTGAYWYARTIRSDKPLGIAEGVATAISVETVNHFPVVAAMSCGNLLSVAKRMRDRFPTRLIYVLADVGNGEQEANEAAYKIGAQIAVPSFTDEMKKSFKDGTTSDFNDYYRIIGVLK